MKEFSWLVVERSVWLLQFPYLGDDDSFNMRPAGERHTWTMYKFSRQRLTSRSLFWSIGMGTFAIVIWTAKRHFTVGCQCIKTTDSVNWRLHSASNMQSNETRRPTLHESIRLMTYLFVCLERFEKSLLMIWYAYLSIYWRNRTQWQVNKHWHNASNSSRLVYLELD